MIRLPTPQLDADYVSSYILFRSCMRSTDITPFRLPNRYPHAVVLRRCSLVTRGAHPHPLPAIATADIWPPAASLWSHTQAAPPRLIDSHALADGDEADYPLSILAVLSATLNSPAQPCPSSRIPACDSDGTNSRKTPKP